jgi:hypothetical protein
MYLHHRGVESVITGIDLIDAIKNRNQNAIVVTVWDEDGTEYIVKEHDEPDEDDYFNYYWVNKITGELLYDENQKSVEVIKEVEEEKDFDNVEILDGDDEIIIYFKKRVIFGDDSKENAPDTIDYHSVKHGDQFTKGERVYTASLESVRKNTKRKVTLNITSYRGISGDAIHYYGKLTFEGADVEFEGTDGKTWNTFADGDFPIGWVNWTIELNRMITQSDKTLHAKRFEDYDVDEPTYRFDTPEDVIQKAKQVFRKRFIGDWDFKIKYSWK